MTAMHSHERETRSTDRAAADRRRHAAIPTAMIDQAGTILRAQPRGGVHGLARRILERAAELCLTTPLAKGCDARDDMGKACHPWSDDAAARSLHGLLRRACYDASRRQPRHESRERDLMDAETLARSLLDTVALAKRGRRAADVNDDSATTRADVVLLLFRSRDLLAIVTPDREPGNAP